MNLNVNPKYKRVLLKLSGEALANGKEKGILDYDFISSICYAVKKCIDAGVQVSIVVGAGNIWRGRMGEEMDRTRADHMGMLATTINSLALQDAFEKINVPCRVLTAIEMKQFAEPYIRNKAISHLSKGRVVIFGCGIGSPFFSTDTEAVLRAAEIGADILLLAKNVDGIYDSDPKKNPAAKKIDRISHMEFIQQDLRAMDATAVTICMENKIPVLAFGLFEENSIVRAVEGQDIGTLIV